MHIILQDFAVILLSYCVAEYDHTWATGVWLVLVRIGLSCPDAHSRLIFLLTSPSWTVYRHLNSLPTGVVWLGCLNLGDWLGIFGYAYVHTSLGGGLLHIHSKKGDTHIHVINHTDHNIGEGQSDLLFLTPPVGHDRVKHSLNG